MVLGLPLTTCLCIGPRAVRWYSVPELFSGVGDLDSNHDGDGVQILTINMQQATVNLFADMGVQPVTLQAGLVSASASTDTVPPTSTITSPIQGSTFQPFSVVTIQGTASDVGGAVAGIEVSTDGGTTWHRANGRGTWSYTWNVSGARHG